MKWPWLFSRRIPSTIVGLDIGTSAVKLAVGELYPDGTLALIGSHQIEARGIRKGEVVEKMHTIDFKKMSDMLLNVCNSALNG